MKRFAILLFIPLFIGCEQPRKIDIHEYQPYFDRLSGLMDARGNMRIFKLSSSDRTMLKAGNGLKIEFDGTKFIYQDGSLPDSTIDVVVTECIRQSDFIKSNVRTMSDHKLLVSGGAYHIQVYCKGKLLQLKENDSLTIHLPRYSEDEMALFYGITDSLNQVNWKPANKVLTKAKKLSLTERDDLLFLDKEFEYYNPIRIKNLDWINCDRFYGENDLVNLDYTFHTSEDTLVSRVLLIFKDINSVASQYYIKSRKSIKYEAFQDIPSGAQVRFIAVSVIHNQIFCFAEDLVTQDKQNVQIDLKKVTEEELNRIINDI